MRISKAWLQKYFDEPLPNTEALCDALTFHVFEIDGVDKHGDDDVLDVKVTANRGHDCLSHRGIAKELSAILKMRLAHDSFVSEADISKPTDAVTVSIHSDLCKRYMAGYIKGVKVGPSPAWLKEKLEAIGQRSINNVVDATNFVMFNTGQPLHAFDAHKLGSTDIGVRMARAGEKMMALDNKEYALTESMLVITAGDTPVGIAGVKGGMPAAIDETTVDIVIESANFDSVSVRKTAQALKLRTDASARFEQNISPELAAHGMKGMIEMVQHLIGGEVVGFVDVYPTPVKQTYVAVTVEQINNTLGTTFTGADIADVFTRLGLAYKEESGVFEVQPPLERLDIVIPEVLIEEVGRIFGYEAVPATPLPKFDTPVAVNAAFYKGEKIREFLQGQGFSEVFTSAFSDTGERTIANKVDGTRPYLRNELATNLAEALEKNIHNKELLELKQVKLFEIGIVWKGGTEEVVYDLAVEKVKGMKGVDEYRAELDAMLAALPEPTAYDTLPLSATKRYSSFSKYPYIVRDIALWVPEGTDAQTLLSDIKTTAGDLAVHVYQFDQFTKEGRTSLAYRIIFQSFEKTLTEAEVQPVMEKITESLKSKGFEIR
ncbi:MAG: phenylalanyl-tRNA synthetase subunit beta, phenylalanyl-tRNA synthetase beta chain [Candidatus Adlerbacteria bacterium]|nr:phenylalanyl-tRNA synthetase subunit beta, phenylalanyl-tRNA synthetase beta chain [Candidatus Adlerbacteria bacterium]